MRIINIRHYYNYINQYRISIPVHIGLYKSIYSAIPGYKFKTLIQTENHKELLISSIFYLYFSGSNVSGSNVMSKCLLKLQTY